VLAHQHGAGSPRRGRQGYHRRVTPPLSNAARRVPAVVESLEVAAADHPCYNYHHRHGVERPVGGPYDRGCAGLRAPTPADHGQLRRVNRALSAWDEHDSAAAMPADVRPQVRPPTLERATLKELQGMLIDRLGELELLAAEAWGERRN
jgi:hypothetical protein